MKNMRLKWIFILLFLSFLLAIAASPILAKGIATPAQILAYDGKTFTGFQDPAYSSYNEALREYLVKRIDQEFGMALDPKKYSGFDLLEIEALFKCKKPNESFDSFLKMFPKRW
jgi:hypothetical protein